MEHKVVDNNDKSVYPSEDKLNKKYSSTRDETLGQMLIRRNKHLIKMFKNTDYNIQLFGRAESPMIVVDNETKISAYVHNFNLYFKSSWHSDSTTVKSFKINFTNEVDNAFLKEFVESYEHEKWAKVQERIKNK